MFDIKTLMFIFFILNIINAFTLGIAQKQSKGRYHGIYLWLISMSLNALGTILHILHNFIPNFVPLTIPNAIIVYAQLLILIGLERFVEKKRNHLHNYAVIIIFIVLHIYFYFFKPILTMRDIIAGVVLAIFAFQSSWLMLRGVDLHMRKITRLVGIIWLVIFVYNTARVILSIFFQEQTNDFYKSGIISSISIFAYVIFNFSNIIGLILMVNMRLLSDVNKQEEKFKKAFYSSPYAIVLTRASDGKIFEINDMFIEMTGYSQEEALDSTTINLGLWVEEENRNKVIETLAKGGQINGEEYLFRKKNGDIITCLVHASVIMINNNNCIISSIADISDRKKTEKRIKVLLAEKEILLKEVHHRIKNNMNSMMGLLSIQANNMKDPAAVSAIEDARSRMQYMAVLYDKLYRNENLNSLSAKEYLPVLADEIMSTYSGDIKIKIEKNIENFMLDISILSPLGIMVNEIINNSMKYAFNGKKNGLIKISAFKKSDHVTISIEDNGSGIPESVKLGESAGFGLNLVYMLTKQLDGKIRVEREAGTKFVLEFDL
jgi:PAS domain S-box-containing protein